MPYFLEQTSRNFALMLFNCSVLCSSEAYLSHSPSFSINKKVNVACYEFGKISCLHHLSSGIFFLQRIRVDGIKNHPWFQTNYVSVNLAEDEEVSLDDVCAVFDDIEVSPIFSY